MSEERRPPSQPDPEESRGRAPGAPGPAEGAGPPVEPGPVPPPPPGPVPPDAPLVGLPPAPSQERTEDAGEDDASPPRLEPPARRTRRPRNRGIGRVRGFSAPPPLPDPPPMPGPVPEPSPGFGSPPGPPVQPSLGWLSSPSGFPVVPLLGPVRLGPLPGGEGADAAGEPAQPPGQPPSDALPAAVLPPFLTRGLGGGTPPRDGPRPPAPLTALVTRLREAELKPTAEEVADALWLARFLPASDPRPPGTGEAGPTAPSAHGTPVRHLDDPAPPAAPQPPPPHPQAPSGLVGLYGPAQPEASYGTLVDASMRRIPVPAPAALPDALALERSLRPLQRYRPPRRHVRRELDEVATADRAADTGIVVPVLSFVRRREARLALVMDESSSNVVWSRALDELRQICERAGAFREVAVHRIAEDDAPPTDLGDPTGRQLTVVLSDCAGPLWRSGRMQRLLHSWAATAPVSVVQPLPQRMWGRTHLPARPGLLRRREGPAGRLEFVPRSGPPVDDGLPVPVLALRRSSFEAWTRLVAGATGRSLNAAAAVVKARHLPAAARARAERGIDPAERVRAFRRTASPAAAQLAVYLSAVPLLLPVMQLVQRAMLGRSGPDVLAEVLLSGLLRRDDRRPAEQREPDGPAYAFLDGVREELLGQLGASSASLVLKQCSEYVESRYGRTVRNFPALAAAFLDGSVSPAERFAEPAVEGPGPESRRLWAFAQVSTQVLRRLGGPSPTATPLGTPEDGPAGLAAQARACLDHFGEHGTVRDLDTAIRLLGSATRAERRTAARAALYGELADSLLRRWFLRPVPEDLPEALDAAQNAIAGTSEAHLTLARLLEIMAEEVAAGRLSTKLLPDWVAVRAGTDGDDPAPMAAVLLAAADGSLAELTEGPGRWDTGLRESATPLRVRVLRRLAVTGAPHALRGPATPGQWAATTLGTAVDVVQALIDERLPGPYPEPDRVEHHEAALLLRGGLLLDLARHHRGEGPVAADAVDPATSRGYAERAGDDLLAAIDGIDPGTGAPGAAAELLRAWLEYADAIELAYEHPDDDARLRILQALDQARRHVERDEAAEAGILLRMARHLEQRHAASGSWSHRDSVIAAWTEALPLLPWRDPGRAGVLTSLGRRLIERGVDKDAPGDVRTAVRHLRGAVDQTAAGDPALPERRALLGHAHLERFRADEALADLHEADWTLGEAARTTTDPALAVTARWHRALATALLARRTSSRERLLDAASHCRAAASASPALLDALLAAQRARVTRLSRSAGPARALEEQDAVTTLLTESNLL
ncbi:SAV_2336 N-terminal domain-related protein [Streptomyces sp. NPDC047315]|uniref:SAV_2336 N-terminal domain-related protein n=1 Tax=Streptomyces sp. NPDC047315 TaxID=3155142 RepID=UPI0033C202A4